MKKRLFQFISSIFFFVCNHRKETKNIRHMKTEGFKLRSNLTYKTKVKSKDLQTIMYNIYTYTVAEFKYRKQKQPVTNR
jgi:hypothetical protein